MSYKKKAETASHASPKVVVHGNGRVWLIFLVRCAVLCRCSMVPCVVMGYRCVACLWGAIRGGRHGKLVDFLPVGQRIVTQWVCKALLPGVRRLLQLSAPGWLIRLCVVNRGFLWPCPDLVGGLCACVLMLYHALICVFISGLCWLLPPSRAVYKYGAPSFVLSRHGWLFPPSRAGHKYGAHVVGLQGSGSFRPEARGVAEICLFSCLRSLWVSQAGSPSSTVTPCVLWTVPSAQSGCALLEVWMPTCSLASPWVAQA